MTLMVLPWVLAALLITSHGRPARDCLRNCSEKNRSCTFSENWSGCKDKLLLRLLQLKANFPEVMRWLTPENAVTFYKPSMKLRTVCNTLYKSSIDLVLNSNLQPPNQPTGPGDGIA